MISTHHAQKRCQQRALNKHALAVIASIGMPIEQKGGTSIVRLDRAELRSWVAALNEVMYLLFSNASVVGGLKKRKIKIVKQLLRYLQTSNQPYVVVDNDEDVLITCGHAFELRKVNP
ncbi:hypothetical protein DXV75_16735 [Alteromonas aestuariivivens]|uniref:Uncharacterized protein n=1 Tax=Alteromonas aestuariivivens TaxID=1938339 RepID=A0A3D8M306_9ALTE|nr:hypothetical protein [Alteromonas aestuariivivens]RDV23914.1 hypothetical protein DXV75_16735 [Alteromonas aestuariivivens]